MAKYNLCLIILFILGMKTFALKSKSLEIITEYKPEECYEYADNGDEVQVHYTGYLDSGSIFDTSLQENRGPLPFVLGQGRVIKGWEDGIKGMCIGEKRKLIIPSHLAYGKKGHPPVIPPDATLTFTTELVDLVKHSAGSSSAAGVDLLIRLVRFLVLPLGVITSIYLLYNKIKASESQAVKKNRGSGGRCGKKKVN